jgi:sulfoxide reductase heme-binding subunit YedZ
MKRAVVSIACALPLLILIVRFAVGMLGADPVRTLLLATGDWTMRLLLLTLAVTPLKDLSGWNGVFFLRRVFGLYSLLYAGLHLLVYLGLDYLFDLRLILNAAIDSPFIMVGFGSFLLLIPLGVTSMRSLMRRMERRNWRILHGLVYLTAIGGVVHYLLKLKVISGEFVVYTVVLALLLLYRPLSWLFIKGSRLKSRV